MEMARSTSVSCSILEARFYLSKLAYVLYEPQWLVQSLRELLVLSHNAKQLSQGIWSLLQYPASPTLTWSSSGCHCRWAGYNGLWIHVEQMILFPSKFKVFICGIRSPGDLSSTYCCGFWGLHPRLLCPAPLLILTALRSIQHQISW